MEEEVHEYTGERIDVSWDAKRCIHARECVRGLPAVFDVDERPWIQPDEAAADEVAEVVTLCPTGALHFERHDGGAPETVPLENTVRVAPDGPLYVHGDVSVETAEGDVLLSDTRVALCQCGASENKPLCDGSHADVGFADDGTVSPAEEPDGWDPSGRVTVVPTPDGPLRVQGAFEMHGSDGGERAANGGFLCRCGASADKPFCDGSHSSVGFSDD
jgi:CDGSH-type Zn-finger protein/uncharacterized Fe-S cluster protein YjdI